MRMQNLAVKLRSQFSRRRLVIESPEDAALLAGDPPTVINVAPSISSGTIRSSTSQFQIEFSGLVTGANLSSNFELRNQGPDGRLGNVDDLIAMATDFFSANKTTLSFLGLCESISRKRK